MNDVGKKKDAGAADDKNPQLNEICRGCGKEVKELSTCLCFCPDSGVALFVRSAQMVLGSVRCAIISYVLTQMDALNAQSWPFFVAMTIAMI